MNSRLYVGNLGFETLEADLQDHFAQAGTVTEATLMQDRTTGQTRGFAFVSMGSADEAEEAIRRFDAQPFQGRSLTVNAARPRAERAGSGPTRRGESRF